jgi:hypothetical protein
MFRTNHKIENIDLKRTLLSNLSAPTSFIAFSKVQDLPIGSILSKEFNFNIDGFVLNKDKDTFVFLPQILELPVEEITIAVSLQVDNNCQTFCNLLWIGDPDQPTRPLFSIFVKNGYSIHIATAMGSLNTANESIIRGKLSFLIARINFKTGELKINVGGNKYLNKFDPVINPTPKAFYIGKGGIPENSFTGILSNLSIWNRILDAKDHKNLITIYEKYIDTPNNQKRLIQAQNKEVRKIVIVQIISLIICIVILVILILLFKLNEIKLIHNLYYESIDYNILITRFIYGVILCFLFSIIIFKAPDIVLTILWPSKTSTQYPTLFYFPLTYGSYMNQGQYKGNLEIDVEDTLNLQTSDVNVVPSDNSYIRMNVNNMKITDHNVTLYFTFKIKTLYSDSRSGLKNVFWMGDEMKPTDPLLSFWLQYPSRYLHLGVKGDMFNLGDKLWLNKKQEITIQFQKQKKIINLFVNGKIKARLPFHNKLAESQIISWSKGLMQNSGFYGSIGDIGVWEGLLKPSEISYFNSYLSERFKRHTSIIIIIRIIAIFLFYYGLLLVLSCIYNLRHHMSLLKDIIWLIPCLFALYLILNN